MDSTSIVPWHKGDDDAIARLQQASGPQIIAVAGQLVAWLADGNWPIAGPISKVLRPYVNDIKQELLAVLRGREADWKAQCIGVIKRATVEKLHEELLAELRLLVANPTTWEREEDVPEEAQEALDRWDHAGTSNEK